MFGGCDTHVSSLDDQDGVVYHENKLIPGAKEMVAWLQKEGKEFLFLTNSSDKTPKDLRYKLSSLGIHVRLAVLPLRLPRDQDLI